jgi:hypothetical protein
VSTYPACSTSGGIPHGCDPEVEALSRTSSTRPSRSRDRIAVRSLARVWRRAFTDLDDLLLSPLLTSCVKRHSKPTRTTVNLTHPNVQVLLEREIGRDDGGRIDGIWSDSAGLDEHASEQPLADPFVAARRGLGWTGFYFGGVAFKYQRAIAPNDLGCRRARHALHGRGVHERSRHRAGCRGRQARRDARRDRRCGDRGALLMAPTDDVVEDVGGARVARQIAELVEDQ